MNENRIYLTEQKRKVLQHMRTRWIGQMAMTDEVVSGITAISAWEALDGILNRGYYVNTDRTMLRLLYGLYMKREI